MTKISQIQELTSEVEGFLSQNNKNLFEGVCNQGEQGAVGRKSRKSDSILGKNYSRKKLVFPSTIQKFCKKAHLETLSKKVAERVARLSFSP